MPKHTEKREMPYSADQLFDLVADPDELHNLWDDPAAEPHKLRLLTELREWRIRSGVHTKDWCSDHR